MNPFRRAHRPSPGAGALVPLAGGVRRTFVCDWGVVPLPRGLRLVPDEPPARGATEPGNKRGEGEDAPATILLVEDDHSLSTMYRHRLEKSGYRVAIASSGAEGLRMIQEGSYDLVFLDLGLPGLDGLAVLEAVRNDDTASGQQVVILSNYSEPDLVKRGMELGALDYLVKANVTPGQVAATASKWVKG